MIAVLKDFPQEALSPEREQELLSVGDTETLVLSTIVSAFQYLRSRNRIHNDDLLSICYAALSRSVKQFKPGMQRFMTYSKPWLRGEVSRYWRELDPVKNAYKHEVPDEDLEVGPPPAEPTTELPFNNIHYAELWKLVEPHIRATLRPKEIKVLEFIYKAGMSLEDAGKQMGLSRSRIYQIHHAALGKLRVVIPKHYNESY